MGQMFQSIVFRWWKPDGTPAFGYTVGFYGAGLSPIPANLKDVYDDFSLSSPIVNPVPLDVEGKARIIPGVGAYKVVIYDEDDVAVWTQDDLDGTGGFGSGFVETIADLRALTSFSPPFVYVAGFDAVGDGAHGMFHWDAASSAADDNGYTIIPDSLPVTGRWKRIPDEDGSVRAAAFDFVENGDTNKDAEIAAADTYAANGGFTLRVNDVANQVLNSFTLISERIVFNQGAIFQGIIAGTATIQIDGIIEAPKQLVFKRFATVTLAPRQVALAEWFGAVVDDTPRDNSEEFELAKASGAGAVLLGPGTWYVDNASTFTIPTTGQVWILQGTIKKNNGTLVYGKGIYTDSQTFGLDATVVRDLAVGRNLDVTNNATIGVNLDAGGIITGGSEIQGFGNVKAGYSGSGGKLQQGIGTSTVLDSPAISTHSAQTAAVSTSGAGEDNLMSRSLEANSLSDSGDAVKVILGGTFSGNIGATETAKIRLYLGGTLYQLFTITGQAGMVTFPSVWHAEIYLVKRSGNIIANGFFVNNGVYAASDPGQSAAAAQTIAAKDMTADRLIQITGEMSDAGDSCTQDIMLIEYMKGRT